MLEAGQLPNLASLGHFQCLWILDPTVTKASWTTQLTGLPAAVHGTMDNLKWQVAPKGWTVFEVLDEAGIQSVYVSGKCRPEIPSGNMCVETGFPLQRASKATFVRSDTWGSLSELTSECLRGIGVIGFQGFAFCHYPTPDAVGHNHGGGSSQYDQALRENDRELGVLLDTLGDVDVLLTSDHGFEKAGDKKELRPEVWPWRPRRPKGQGFGYGHTVAPLAILASSLSLKTPANGRDLAKTVYDILGVEAPNWPDGRSLK